MDMDRMHAGRQADPTDIDMDAVLSLHQCRLASGLALAIDNVGDGVPLSRRGSDQHDKKRDKSGGFDVRHFRLFLHKDTPHHERLCRILQG
jgi:hypothetical protein